MIQRIAKGLTTQMIDHKTIETSMAEVYQYGLELTLSTMLTTLSIIGIACLTDSFLYGLLLATSPVRNPHHPVSDKVLRKNKNILFSFYAQTAH